MPNDKEKLIICELMRELIGERRGISMLYHDFKKKLDHIMEKIEVDRIFLRTHL